MLVVSSLACGQESIRPTSKSDPPPLEIKLTKAPQRKGSYIELSVQRTNCSKLPIFLDGMYGGIKVYSSVTDATNTLRQGSGEAWMLVYGWTDVVSESVKLAPGAKRQDIISIPETFLVKETGKDKLREVRVQGKLRVVAGYEIPTWRTIDQSQGRGRRAYVRVVDNSDRWKLAEVALEIPIPCPNGIITSDCVSPPPIFPGEHDVYTIELEPPPAIEPQPPPPPIVWFDHVDHPLPPKP